MVKYYNCKNIKSKKYTGQENTPLGLGYHASGEKIEKKMEGKNGHMYKVIKTKNGKRWHKYTSRGCEQGLYPPITK